MICVSTIPSIPILETRRRLIGNDRHKALAGAIACSILMGVSLWGTIAVGVSVGMLLPATSPWILMVLLVTALVMTGGIGLTVWYAVEIENEFLRKASAREWEQWKTSRYGADPFES